MKARKALTPKEADTRQPAGSFTYPNQWREVRKETKEGQKTLVTIEQEFVVCTGGLVELRALSDFNSLHDWQRAIRATVDLFTLAQMYRALNGPDLDLVRGGTQRTEDLDRAWMRAWLYYKGTLEHIRLYAQPMHWKDFGEDWDSAIKKIGGSVPLITRLNNLRYDRPLWDTTKKEVVMATKEKKRVAKEKKQAPVGKGPLGFRKGTDMGDAAELLEKEGKLSFKRLENALGKKLGYFLQAGRDRKLIVVDKDAEMVSLVK